MEVFKITKASGEEIPIILSVPHCGTKIPGELEAQFKPEMIASIDDTDWLVDKLYDFAADMGITMISAVYSRWVIDLNRDPLSKPLYTDGRLITGLCPSTDFLGNKIYKDERDTVTQDEIDRRMKTYYQPFHDHLKELLSSLQKKFTHVLLWDCHSIRQHVPSIQKERFPDLILGSADGRSASKKLIETAFDCLHTGKYQLRHNHPFKGGFITRHYGKPERNVHALQLEMTKVNYMDEAERAYSEEKAQPMRSLLQSVLQRLSHVISSS